MGVLKTKKIMLLVIMISRQLEFCNMEVFSLLHERSSDSDFSLVIFTENTEVLHSALDIKFVQKEQQATFQIPCYIQVEGPCFFLFTKGKCGMYKVQVSEGHEVQLR